jgi:hypothetical protein
VRGEAEEAEALVRRPRLGQAERRGEEKRTQRPCTKYPYVMALIIIETGPCLDQAQQLVEQTPLDRIL